MRIELMGRCPQCNSIRTVFGVAIDNPTPDDMDRAEDKIDQRGGADAHCPRCDSIEDVAMFSDGIQAEPWMNAIEYERLNGPDAGPLPPRPWRKYETL